MTDHYPLRVPGATPTDATIKVTSPFDERLLATFEVADQNSVNLALDTAFQLHRNRRELLPLPKRLEILKKTAELMTERAEKLALAAAEEGGKPLIDSRTEVARAIDGVHLCIETMRTTGGEVIPMGTNQASLHKTAFTTLEPRGVVVAISAFNHPLNLIVHQVAPAVAT